jgi:hypothetical protein
VSVTEVNGCGVAISTAAWLPGVNAKPSAAKEAATLRQRECDRHAAIAGYGPEIIRGVVNERRGYVAGLPKASTARVYAAASGRKGDRFTGDGDRVVIGCRASGMVAVPRFTSVNCVAPA